MALRRPGFQGGASYRRDHLWNRVPRRIVPRNPAPIKETPEAGSVFIERTVTEARPGRLRVGQPKRRAGGELLGFA